MNKLCCPLVLGLSLFGGTVSADVLRCGAGIVEAGALEQALIDTCGDPDSKSIEGMNWIYQIDGHNYEVRLSDGGVVAEIREVDE